MSRYLVRQQDVKPYSPANHSGTRNFRLIEQVCYLLEGNAHVEVGGQKFEMKPGEACFFPADTVHLLIVTSERAKVLVVYSPPYLEKHGR
jgi:quercetin dioxygenase-like cupin family protein